ncbi:MAG TPA: hypothetical protein VHG08_23440 [Longimicrobium sp.]|nr:hypothetical protein [Longimicrobium sp.]
MKKLQLNVEELAVESFATDGRAGAKSGTVHGHYGTGHTDFTCSSCNSGCHTWLCVGEDENRG